MQRTGIIKVHSNLLRFADLVGFQLRRARNKLCISVIGGGTMGQSRSGTERISFKKKKYKEIFIRRYSRCMLLLGTVYIYLPCICVVMNVCVYSHTYLIHMWFDCECRFIRNNNNGKSDMIKLDANSSTDGDDGDGSDTTLTRLN